MTDKYVWDPIPEGETPEWGEWVRRADWDGDEAEQFIGVHPENPNRWVFTDCDDVTVTYLRLPGRFWLRRVEVPAKWEKKWIVCDERGLDCRCESEHVRGHRLARIWCDQDDELHVEWVES